MRCRSCDTLNPDTYRHCSNCGAALTGCEHCGFEISPEARFCGGCGRPVATPKPERKATQAAERRYTTILFCDLIGSTQLSNTLDPEDLRTLIVRYHEIFRKVIEANGGFVAQYLGDGILAYFGYPVAREDDAERAVRAGLELVDEVARSESDYEIRVGIASGMVVVGDLRGNDFFDREPAVGSTPNLAARAQEVAKGGWVVVSPMTRNIVGDQFEFEDLGSYNLKGFSEPVPLARAITERTGIIRFEASHTDRGLSSLVGRERELESIMRCWELAKTGQGQVVCLLAEPGLGKSRLTIALTSALANESFTELRYQCGPHFSNTALYPIISQIERSAGFARGDTAEVKLDKLEALLARAGADDFEGSVRYIAALVSILFANRYAPIEETAERQKEQTLGTLVAQIKALSARQPVILLFEDVHWIDPTTLELLMKTVTVIETLPVLLLVTARPEFSPPWKDAPNSKVIELGPLSESDSLRVIEEIAAPNALPDSTKRGILARSEGNPLFIEELTRAVVESGDGGGRANRATVPESLQASLHERLDRDYSNKSVAQVAAALGRDFTVDLLAAATQIRSTELGLVLERLIDANIIQRNMDLTEPVYRFKHALLQDAAYESMLLVERSRVHRRVAEALESEFPEITEKQPETVARHLSEAGETERAIGYWQRAGERAAERAAHSEAVDHFSKALALLRGLPETIDRHGRELVLLGQYGLSLSASQGYAAPEVENTQLRALELCELIGDPDTLYAVKRRLCTFFIVRSDFERARQLAQQCIELGEIHHRSDYLIEGYNALGYVYAYQGEFDDAMTALERAVRIYREDGGSGFVYPTEQDPLLAALSQMALVCSLRGERRQAIRHVEEAIEIAKRMKKPFDLAYAESYYSAIEHIQRSSEGGQLHGRISAEICEKHGFALWLWLSNIYSVFSLRDDADIDGRIQFMNENMAAHQLSGARLFRSFLLGCLAQTYLLADKHMEANKALRQAFDHVERFNERIYESALHRIKGDLQAAMGRRGNASECFHTAVDVARGMGAKLLELQALISLARLEGKDDGVSDDARSRLADLLGELTSHGEALADLKDARQLLAASA